MVRSRSQIWRIRRLRRGLRDTRGTAAIEFAMIAPVFFLLMFASFETGMTYFANMTLENGVMEAARLVRTGQAQQSGMSASEFRTYLCDRVDMLLSCDADKLFIDVQAFSSFGGAGYQDEFDDNGDLNGNLNNFNTGQSSASAGAQDIVLVRAFYKWPLFSPGFAKYYSNMPNDENYRLVSSSFAFRNEPY